MLQVGLAQFTWSSQDVPHVWHLAMTSSEIRSAKRSSKTKFLPTNLLRGLTLGLAVYSMMPPSNWWTLGNPCA